MRYGRYMAIAGVLVACLLGCTVRRNGSSVDSGTTKEQFRYDQLYARTDAKVSVSSTVTDRWRNIRIYWRNYDTGQPADSTGNRPVLSEGWIDGNEQESTDESTETEETGDEVGQTAADGTADGHFEKTRTEELEVKGGTTPVMWWMFGVATAAVLIIFFWLRYGKKNKTE